jgi:serine protease
VDGASISPATQTPLWNLKDDEPYSIKAEGVWEVTNGTQEVVVAVIDTGIAELAKPMFLNLLDGYDFITDEDISNHWDGRDSDATDPGDWGDTCPTISWHGTKVASIIAARHDNEFGMKGVAQNCSILPLRVLGLCRMGYATDVTDAIVWAAGGVVNEVPNNPNPAQIISLSLAGQGLCPSYLQSAVTQARELGAVVIAAVGNHNQNVSGFFPANCNGVVPVAASTRQGKLAGYSNWGNLIAVSAPVPS